MNGTVEMECDRECRLLLNDLNGILSEQCLEQRVIMMIRYHIEQ